jgi:transcriptional regulator with XRE-family HTH domain
VADRNTRGARLRKARERLGLTQNETAEKLGIPPSTYSSKERAQQPGGRDFKWEEARDIARHLKVDAQWLYTGEGTPPDGEAEAPKHDGAAAPRRAKEPTRTSNRPIPIVGYVGASTGEGALYGFAHDQFDEVSRPSMPEKAVAVEIRGKSFGPLMDGMLVFYEDVRRPVTDDLIGSICVLGLADNRILLKKIVRSGGTWRLLSNSPDEAPIENAKIEWAAKMIAITPR